MPYVHIDYMDGRYRMTIAEIPEEEGAPDTACFVSSDVFAAYHAHRKEDEVYQTLLRLLDNDRGPGRNK